MDLQEIARCLQVLSIADGADHTIESRPVEPKRKEPGYKIIEVIRPEPEAVAQVEAAAPY